MWQSPDTGSGYLRWIFTFRALFAVITSERLSQHLKLLYLFELHYPHSFPIWVCFALQPIAIFCIHIIHTEAFKPEAIPAQELPGHVTSF